jgi:hypothetical protein
VCLSAIPLKNLNTKKVIPQNHPDSYKDKYASHASVFQVVVGRSLHI